jgi:hypothetical protein
MRFPFALLLAATCLSAQSRYSAGYSATDHSVTIDGQPFATFNYGNDANKPFLAPIRSASGKIITRRFPMQEVAGESHDHLHHRGLWFSYDDVNGVKFWENDPSYTKPNIGKIVVRDSKWQGATLSATMDWRAPGGNTLLVESRKMTFSGDAKTRMIDFEITLTASEDVTLGDTKEGAFAIRLDDQFTEKKGGKMVDADGRIGMVNVWGKRSNWVDYSTELNGERLGVAIFDHPQNPRHPTYWHARDYGLFALNPFGRNAFDENAEVSNWKLPKGQSLTFRWRVVVHAGDTASGHVAEMYRDYK